MKKSTDKTSVSRRTIGNDLKTFFQSEEYLVPESGQEEPAPQISLEDAVRLFDELRAGRKPSPKSSVETKWTHPSVVKLLEDEGGDPVSKIVSAARTAVIAAMEKGWSGPPYNPFTLAGMRGIKLLPTENVSDARTRSSSTEQFTIEFNPQRTPARMRYSIAHEIGHTLFRDCAAEVRNRTTHEEMRGDEWQLEFLCNMAAAEILMPFGTLQEEMSIRPSVGLILDLRRKYLVSSEAVVNRLVRLSAYPCTAFFARLDTSRSRYFVEYRIPSPALRQHLGIYPGYVLPQVSKVSECTVIGTRQQEDAGWISEGKPWFIEYLGISPNPGEKHPRVLGMAFPPLADSVMTDLWRVTKGDASEPIGAEPKLLLQVVNDQARIWGGGFAKKNGKKWTEAQADFRQWAFNRNNLKLGNIRPFDIQPDLTLVSLVAQHGFGRPTSGPRIKYGYLLSALEKVADLAVKKGASVHMPRIGTGEAGGNWNVIEGIVKEALTSRGIKVTIYDFSPASHDFARQTFIEFPSNIVDEVF